MPALHLLQCKVEIIARCKRGDAEPVRVGLDDVQGAATDGTGGAQDGYSLHEYTNPNRWNRRWNGLGYSIQGSLQEFIDKCPEDDKGNRRRKKQGVNSVEHAAMPGKQGTGVLDRRATLDHAIRTSRRAGRHIDDEGDKPGIQRGVSDEDLARRQQVER